MPAPSTTLARVPGDNRFPRAFREGHYTYAAPLLDASTGPLPAGKSIIQQFFGDGNLQCIVGGGICNARPDLLGDRTCLGRKTCSLAGVNNTERAALKISPSGRPQWGFWPRQGYSTPATVGLVLSQCASLAEVHHHVSEIARLHLTVPVQVRNLEAPREAAATLDVSGSGER